MHGNILAIVIRRRIPPFPWRQQSTTPQSHCLDLVSPGCMLGRMRTRRTDMGKIMVSVLSRFLRPEASLWAPWARIPGFNSV